MAELTEDTMRNVPVPAGSLPLNVRPSMAYPTGALIAHRFGSKLAEVADPDSPRSDLIVRGWHEGPGFTATDAVGDDSASAVNARGEYYRVFVRPGLVGDLDTGADANEITVDDIGKPCYMFDNNTVYLTDESGALSFAGIVRYVDDAGKVTIWIEADPVAPYVFGDNGEADTLRADLASQAAGKGTALIGDDASNGTLAALLATLTVKSVQIVQDAGTLVAGSKVVNTGITVTASSVFLAIRNKSDAIANVGKLSTGSAVVGAPGTGAVTVTSDNNADTSTISLVVIN